jgi:hypothetical protein
METNVPNNSAEEAPVAQTHAVDTVTEVTRIFVIFSPNQGLLRPSRSWVKKWPARVKR